MTHPPAHLTSPITRADLRTLGHLLPPTGHQLLRVLGEPDGLTLINALGGAQLLVPKGPCNNASGARRWAYLAGIVGNSAMQALASALGGCVLEVPTGEALRRARRHQAIRAWFDTLTAPAPQGCGLSKAAAVQELVLRHAPITFRQIEVILDQPSGADALQDLLFED